VGALALVIGGAIFGGVGSLLLWWAVPARAAYLRALEGSARAEGLVVEMRRERSELSIYDYPLVRFTTPGGRVVDFEASIRRDPPRHKVGDRVPVYYSRDDPSRADIVGTEAFSILMAMALGVVFLLVGLLSAVLLMRCLFLGECPSAS
jgi:hypothetical protein